jgi:DNA-binding PadR family transcriptional regulator
MTDAELTILSLLAEGPRFGHEVQRVIDERGLREWLTVGFSSVYYILNKLESRNLLQSELRATGRTPGRKVYSLTEAGRGVLQTAVSDLLRQPRSLGTGFELGLANLSALKPRQVYRVMVQHQAELKERLDAVERSYARQQGDEDMSMHIAALYTHSIALMKAELEWMSSFLVDWRERYPASAKDDTQPRKDAPSHAAATQLHRQKTPAPDKMIQRLKRLRPKDKNDDDTAASKPTRRIPPKEE